MSTYTSAAELPPSPLGREPTDTMRKASWRTFRPVILIEKCTQCNQCWKFCPDVAVGIDEEGWPFIRYEACKGCGICAEVCAPEAIGMDREV